MVENKIIKGIELSEKNYPDKAEKLFLEAAEEEPENPYPYYNLGVLYLKKKDPGAAAAAFEKYFSISETKKITDEEKADIFNDTGAVYFSNRDFKSAKEYFTKALSFNKEHEDAGYNLLLVNTYLEIIM